MSQLIRHTRELCISDIPGVGIIHVAPCLILHGVVCNTVIDAENYESFVSKMQVSESEFRQVFIG